jgi:hypothetical protein
MLCSLVDRTNGRAQQHLHISHLPSPFFVVPRALAEARNYHGGGLAAVESAKLEVAPPWPGRRTPKPRHLLRGGEAFFVLA